MNKQITIGYNLNELGEYVNKTHYGPKLQQKITPEEWEEGEPWNAFYTPQYAPEYKQGDWLYVEDSEERIWWVKSFICKHSGDGKTNFIVWADGGVDITEYEIVESTEVIKGLATEEQLLSHLTAAAVKKGYVKGAKIRTPKGNVYTVYSERFMLTKRNLCVEINHEVSAHILSLTTLKWAEIIEPKAEQVNPDYIYNPQPQQGFESSEKPTQIHEVVSLPIRPVSISFITLSNGKVITAEELNKI